MDPFKFGAVRVGTNIQADGRETAMVSEPSPGQFAAAIAAVSTEWKRLNDRLRRRAKRAGVGQVEYFRVVELHRNGWPHLHALIEHASWGADDLAGALGGWSLGRWDARDVSLDDAIGEVAPYLVSGERKSGGSKAYQFAGVALPPGFRLHSSSRNFLGGVLESEDEKPDYGVTLRGHFASYHQALKEMGADARLCLYPPSEGEYVPPARTVAYGDVALVYFAELVSAKALHVHPGAVGAILDRRSDSG